MKSTFLLFTWLVEYFAKISDIFLVPLNRHRHSIVFPHVEVIYARVINEFRCLHLQAYKEVDDTTANSSANTADSARATSNSATTSIGNAWIGAKIYLTPPADFPEIYWKQKCFDTKQVQHLEIHFFSLQERCTLLKYFLIYLECDTLKRGK